MGEVKKGYWGIRGRISNIFIARNFANFHVDMRANLIKIFISRQTRER